ncbi:disease resistance protein RFL1-like [Magnolia sinica]|uniref:disease resistance protein RFL1-like n=1 Tax=Magnolia sinica TaxID=86752 RepID=UPI00265872F6|nr:disease resistance protein RFL1-like [Magnolia sinica]
MEFIWKTAKTAWDQYNYASNLKENLDVMKTQMQELRTQASDVKIELNMAEVMHGKKPKGEVSLWLENVERITSQMTTTEEDYKEVGRDFLRSRVALGKLVIKKIEEVVKIREKSRFSEGLFGNLLPEMGSVPTTKLVGRTTAERNLKKIWESLMDDEVRIIGVYGVGGMGKTTIMTHIHNRIQSSGKFGIVIWVTVSHNANIEILQKGIARAIGLKLSYEEDRMRRPMKLFQAPKSREKFVIILDDM